MNDLFELPSEQLRKSFAKAGAYDEAKHPRDEKGRWTAGGIARTATVAGTGLVGAAALGVPGVRNLIPGVRRAVLAARYRAARRAASPANVYNVATRGNPAATLRDSGSIIRRPFRGTVQSGVRTARSMFNTAAGALGATGHERALTSAVRAQRRQYSTATVRRARRTLGQ